MILRILLAALAARGDGDAWPEFHGPGGQGRSEAVGLPREWSDTKNVLWKTPLHGRGWSSPVVWGKQVWLTTATPEGKELYAVAVDRETGKLLLDAKVFQVERPEDTQKYNSFASPTPAVEEGKIYIHFGSYGTCCLSTKNGQVLWSRRDLRCNHWRGPGSSPILFKNLLILSFDGYDQQYVVALDKNSGKSVWKTDRAHDYGTNDGDLKKAFSTPVVIQVGNVPVLVTGAAKGALAYEALTGREIWRVGFAAHSCGARPVVGQGLVYLSTGFSKAELVAMRTDGRGDVTKSHVVWRTDKGVGQKPSPILVGDLIYTISDSGGILTALDAKTGAEAYKQRVGGNFSASPAFGDGTLYFVSEEGETVLVRPGRAYAEAGRNRLEGTGRVMASPAISGKSLFIRTDQNLYRIESR